MTGGHVASLERLGDRSIDVCSIDNVTWRLFSKFRPVAAERYRILDETVASLRAIGPTGPAALELLVFETYVLRASVAIGCPTVLRGDEVCVLVKLCWLARALFIFVGNSLGQSGQY